MVATLNQETEIDILDRAVSSDKLSLSAQEAEICLRMGFDDAAKKRILELGERNNAGTITPDEFAIYENYVRVGQFINIIKSKARLALGRPLPVHDET
jgi:hypothetical protein